MFGLTRVSSRNLIQLRIQAQDRDGSTYFIQRQFRFAHHGGERQALAVALKERDALLGSKDVIRYRNSYTRRPVRHRSASPPQTGKTAFPNLAGIALKLNRKPDKTYWSVHAQAGSHSTADKTLSRSYSLKKMGVKPAVQAAVEAREKFFGQRLYDPATVQADILRFYEDYRVELGKAGITLETPASHQP